MTKDDFLKQAFEKHNGKYNYVIEGDIVYARDNVKVICPKHGIFECNVYEHLKHGRGCKKCASEQNSIRQTGTLENFLEKAKLKHGDRYDYSKVDYQKSNINVCIICHENDRFGNEHGCFLQKPNIHLRGGGCPKCAHEKRGSTQRLTTEQFIDKAKSIHGDKFIYDKVEYVNINTKVCVTCRKHGDFYITPLHHLSGEGCNKCRYEYNAENSMMTTEEFIEKAINKHGTRFDYSKVVYKGYNEYVTIGCPIHGYFEQTPDSHLHSQGCPKCGVTLSCAEDEIVSLLRDNLGEESVITRSRRILDSHQELDIYIPSKSIAIEYDGLYWHCEEQKDDINYHINKTLECEKKGIRLIHIFEDEYKNNEKLVKSKLLYLIGKKTFNKVVSARKNCRVIEINKDTAKSFLNDNHIQGFVNGTIHLGCYHEGEIVAVMSFKRITNNSTRWELVRYATRDDILCRGVAGKMFKYFTNNYDATSVKSFADRRWSIRSKNNLYESIGFRFDGYTKISYSYFKRPDVYNRIHKFNMRKSILNRKYGLPMTMTEFEMTDKLGYKRIWDCGLIKYVWERIN